MTPRAVCTSSDIAGAPLDLRIDGLSSLQRVEVHCRALDAEGTEWASWAAFQSDDRGGVDLRTSMASDGGYRGIDSRGLLWSLEPATRGAREMAVSRVDYKFEVRACDRVIATTSCSRFGLAPGLQRTDVCEDGVRGILFSPPGEGPRPGVVVLGGNSGDHAAWPRAAFLANQGFVALLVEYCGEGGLPPCEGPIRIEDLQAAIGWLARSNRTTGNQVGIYGHSSGGTAALIAAQGNPHVGALVLMATSPLVLPLSASNRRSPWTLGGRMVDAVPVGVRGLTRFLRSGRDSTQAALIDAALGDEPLAIGLVDLASIAAPILVMHGRQDALLPVRPVRHLADLLEQRDDGSCAIIHEGAGHMYRIPGVPSRDTSLRRLLGVDTIGGGSAEANALASTDAWERTLSTFETVLGRPNPYRSAEVVVDLDVPEPSATTVGFRCTSAPSTGIGSWTLSVIDSDEQWVRVGAGLVEGTPSAIYRTPSEPDGLLTVPDPFDMRFDVVNAAGTTAVSVGDEPFLTTPGSTIKKRRLRVAYASFGDEALVVTVTPVSPSAMPYASDLDQPGVIADGMALTVRLPLS